MNLLNKNNQNQTKDSNSILSASKPQNTILNINSKQEIQFQTKLKQKKVIKIYIEGNKYYIEHSTAYALGLISTEEFYSLDNEYYYISKDLFDNLKAKFEIEFHSLNLEEEIHKKR